MLVAAVAISSCKCLTFCATLTASDIAWYDGNRQKGKMSKEKNIENKNIERDKCK